MGLIHDIHPGVRLRIVRIWSVDQSFVVRASLDFDDHRYAQCIYQWELVSGGIRVSVHLNAYYSEQVTAFITISSKHTIEWRHELAAFLWKWRKLRVSTFRLSRLNEKIR